MSGKRKKNHRKSRESFDLKESPQKNEDQTRKEQPIGYLAMPAQLRTALGQFHHVDIPGHGEGQDPAAGPGRVIDGKDSELVQGKKGDENRENDRDGPGPPADGRFQISHGSGNPLNIFCREIPAGFERPWSKHGGMAACPIAVWIRAFSIFLVLKIQP
jgi:hypothetical protein